ncbi:MAG: SRPBCC family protein [Solirubrobacteraceae bacterium]
MATWTARTRLPGPPEAVLALLTDPDAIALWAPVGFELVDYEGRRLIAGDRVRVRGALAGPSVSFDVDVAEADDGRLALTATGPIRLDVDYRVDALGECSELRASVTVSGNGLRGRLLARATETLLAAGALSTAVGRIAEQLTRAETTAGRRAQFGPRAIAA